MQKNENASDFDKKKFYEASEFGLKKIQRVRLWIKIFSTCQVLKNSLHQKNYVLVQFTPWKRKSLHFWCFYKEDDFELKFSKRVRFWYKSLQRAGIRIEKNTFPRSHWTRHVFILKKHNTSEFQLKNIQPLRDELTGGNFQLYIWWLNLKQTLCFNFLP